MILLKALVVLLSWAPAFSALFGIGGEMLFLVLLAVYLLGLFVLKPCYSQPYVWLCGALLLYLGFFLIAGMKYFPSYWSDEYPIVSTVIYGISAGMCIVFSKEPRQRLIKKINPLSRVADVFTVRLCIGLQLASLVILFLVASRVLSSGIVLKGEIAASGIVRPYALFNLSIFCFLIVLTRSRCRLCSAVSIVFQVMISLIAIGILGERSPVFVVVVSSMMLWFGTRRCSPVLVLLGICLLPLVVSLANVGRSLIASGGENIYGADQGDYLEFLAKDEFISAGRNISVLLNDEDDEHPTGRILAGDLMLGVLPGSFCPNAMNGRRYYRNTYFEHLIEKGQGVGFSFHGEGWLVLGWAGLVIWSVILAGFAVCIYNMAFCCKGDNYWLMIAFAFLVPNVAYCIRADLSTLMALSLKQTFIPILFLALMEKLYLVVRGTDWHGAFYDVERSG
jgi:hypothetical protein